MNAVVFCVIVLHLYFVLLYTWARWPWRPHPLRAEHTGLKFLLSRAGYQAGVCPVVCLLLCQQRLCWLILGSQAVCLGWGWLQKPKKGPVFSLSSRRAHPGPGAVQRSLAAAALALGAQHHLRSASVASSKRQADSQVLLASRYQHWCGLGQALRMGIHSLWPVRAGWEAETARARQPLPTARRRQIPTPPQWSWVPSQAPAEVMVQACMCHFLELGAPTWPHSGPGGHSLSAGSLGLYPATHPRRLGDRDSPDPRRQPNGAQNPSSAKFGNEVQ